MQTVGSLFGTGAVVPGTGILTNSSLHFSYLEHPGANRIVPGGQVEQNPCISIVFDSADHVVFAMGSPGGKTRVQTVRQMVANVLDFGMDLQAAVDAPRFLAGPDGVTVYLEPDLDAGEGGLRAELTRRGHRVAAATAPLGSGQAVGFNPLTGARLAAADYRFESVALAF
jgi:gamma-glutamyltranspeptidase/glutathione hydrolase